MKFYTFTLFISTALSIPSLVGSVGSVGSIGSIGKQFEKLDVGKGIATNIGKAVDGDSLETVGRTAGSATSGAEGGLNSVKIGENVAGDVAGDTAGGIGNVGR